MVDRLILGIDFGTSNTVAVLGGPGRQMTRILFDGHLRLPSGVYASDRDRLLTGRVAVQASYTHPERYAAHPKLMMSNESVELGPYEYSPVDLVAAVLERVWQEATLAAQPHEISETVITHPQYWGPGRVAALKTAATRVGVTKPRFIREPIAAAALLDRPTYADLREDRAFVVYDLGAGTFDASIVQRKRSGFEVLLSAGLPDVAGLALDRAIAEWLATQVSREDPNAVERVEHPKTNSDRREAQVFLDTVRDARESLSTQTAVQIYYPHYENEVILTREKFEELAEPVLQKTVNGVRDLVSDAGLAVSDVDAIFLVGGASRTPLVQSMLRNEFKRRVTVLTDPEQAVAEGSVGVSDARPTPVSRAERPSPARAVPPPKSPTPPPVERPRERPEPRRPALRVLIIGAAVVLLLGGGTAVALLRPWEGDGQVATDPTQRPSRTGPAPVPGDGFLRIAALLPQTGTARVVGEGIYAGYKLAIDDINKAGGVLGQKVDQILTDSGDNATDAGIAVRSAFSRDADVFIGASTSGVTLAVLGDIVERERLMISPSNTALSLTNFPDNGLYFRTAPPDTFQGAVVADLVRNDGRRSVGLIARADDYGKGLAEILVARLTELNIKVERIDYEPGSPGFTSIAGQLASAKPDAVIMIGYDETAQLIPTLVANSITTQTANWYLVDGNFIDYGADLSPGTMTGAKATQPGSAVTEELKTRLLAIERGLRNFAYSPEGYDATVLAALAAEEAGSDNPSEVKKHMISVSRGGQECTTFAACKELIGQGIDIDYEGLSGPIEFDSAGDPTEASVGIYVYDEDNHHSLLRYVTKIL